MISLQKLNYIPELTLRMVNLPMTRKQRANLSDATSMTFIVRRGERVICMFGFAEESLLCDYFGSWFGLVKGITFSMAELKMINQILDALSEFYVVAFRAAVLREDAMHNKFAKFCKFKQFHEDDTFISYERGAV